MIGKIIFFIMMVFILIGYILIINVISITDFSYSDNSDSQTENNSDYYFNGTHYVYDSNSYSGERVGFGHSVSVSIERHRWYGTIYESGENGDLYLFDLLLLPSKNKDINFLYIHLVFFIFWFFLLVIFPIFWVIKSLKGGVKYEEVVESLNNHRNLFYSFLA